ncbi:DUF2695 domain-containing protein [Amycolatopsis sp.]|uniref:DUF2695 domain-containing protein n=1 Tax=Amycolatopsis sp. TaxID=37632 RepID=UPI002D1DEF75|nr:DUF2695 domain-containing protein [Amycolatopsis sp.]HVV08737.1 DUF2695 domain-containing protein [Amycolatopsis sp.]
MHDFAAMDALLREQWSEPGERECLPCYVGRMLADFGCANKFRWVTRWREHNAPGAVALEQRFVRRGARCDCEVALKIYPDQIPGADPPVPCAGVSRRGSTRPCGVRPRPPPPA